MAWAAGPPPPVVPPQRMPVVVNDLGITAKLRVDRLKSALQAGEEYGHISSGMFCSGARPLKVGDALVSRFGSAEASMVTQLLKNHGYSLAMLGATDAYTPDLAAAPDFRLGGILREVKAETCSAGNDLEGWIYLKVDWALYSEKEQKVVFQQTTGGLAVSDRKVSDLWRQAILASAGNFIGAPEFLAVLAPGVAAGHAAGDGVPAQPTRKPMPGGTVRLPPVVTIKTPIQAEGLEPKTTLVVDAPKLAMLPGDEFGHRSTGSLCLDAKPYTANDKFLATYGDFIRSVASATLKKHGYPQPVRDRASAFDTELNVQPDFRLGGIVKDLHYEICQSEVDSKSEGWSYVKIDWALYSTQARRVVFQQTTEGLFKSSEKIPQLATKMVTTSVENLLAVPEFLAALRAPQAVAAVAADPASGVDKVAAVPPVADGRPLQLGGHTPMPGGAQKNQAQLRAAVVTLETARGTGSGFYIDREGYLLTAFHVVDGAKFVKIKLPNGDKLAAQVVKLSARDDVALLKSAPLDVAPLALRADPLDVGEEVFAIGTPLGVLTSTMTRGVLSADRVIEGFHLLQSDAAITFGSSGGPLLDGDGRVIGLTRGGVQFTQGFNFFTPIQDALRALEVVVKK